DQQLEEMVRGQIALAHYGWQPYMHNPQLPLWLHRIKIPTLVVRGHSDRLIAAAVHEKYRNLIPNARLHVVPNTGHFPNIEQPEQFTDLLASFVEQGEPARTRVTA